MRLVHLSDLHLGFRQYQRLTRGGINQREADVAATFRRTVDKVIELRPDVVVIAGDIFHNVRPTNPAILHAFGQFSRLARELADAIIVIIAGNHDLPRSSETGCILRLFSPLGIHVVDDAPRRLSFPEHDLSILAVPDIAGTRPALVPEPGARYNVLLLHGEVQGMLPAYAVTLDRASLEIPKEDLHSERWSYVALGHYHVYREIGPNTYYAGSIDYTSANAWGELREERSAGLRGKGFVEHDLASGAHTFHHLPPSRELIDLPPVFGSGRSAAEVDAAIRAVVEGCSGGIDDKIVRLVVRDVPRHIARDLDFKTVREYKRRALYFLLDVRRPEVVRASASGAPGRAPPLAEVVAERLRARPLASDVDREAFVRLGLEYLAQVEAEASAGEPAAAAGEPS